MTKLIAVVDYDAGNVFGVLRGLRAAGCADPVLVTAPEDLLDKDVLLLPGVGAFGHGMDKLRASGMDRAVVEFAGTGKQILGICLGMQLLFSKSREFGEHEGLNLIPGEVLELPELPGFSIPNVGWNSVQLRQDCRGTLLKDVQDGDDFYFAHSFYCMPDNSADIIGTIEWGPQALPAIVGRHNIMGCQFHPEISDWQGLSIYRQLLS
jgi:glutamine amidotransferase